MKLVRALAAAAVFAGSPSLAARERLAVFVAVEAEPSLAENLAEVTIAKLAERGEFELVGTRELEASSHGIPTVRAEGLAACVELPACLADVGRHAGTERAVLGKVRRNDVGYEVELALVRTQTFQTDARRHETSVADVEALIVALQTAAAGLLAPSAAAAETPAASPPPSIDLTERSAAAAAAPAVSPAAAPAVRGVAHDSPSSGLSAPTVVGFAAAGLASIAFTAGGLLAIASDAPPSGATRAERQADIDHRRDQASAANVLFVTGGVLSATAVVAFVWPW